MTFEEWAMKEFEEPTLEYLWDREFLFESVKAAWEAGYKERKEREYRRAYELPEKDYPK